MYSPLSCSFFGHLPSLLATICTMWFDVNLLGLLALLLLERVCHRELNKFLVVVATVQLFRGSVIGHKWYTNSIALLGACNKTFMVYL